MTITIPTALRPRKVGNSMVVTIPAEICEQLKLNSDTLLQVTITPVEQVLVPKLEPELQGMLDEILERHHDDMTYLRDH